MADTELNISPDEKVAGVPLARLLRNLDDTSYNEGSVDLACRLTDCKAVIEELLQQRALASRPAEVDDEGLPAVLFDGHAVYIEITRKLGKAHCHNHETVSATLDAVVRLMRAAPAKSSR